jgi:hypothetical protein
MTRHKKPPKTPKDDAAFGDLRDAFDEPGLPSEGVLGPLDLGLLRTALWIEEYGDLGARVREWQAADFKASGKKHTGPTPWMPPEKIVVLLLVLGLRRQPILFTTMRDMIRDDFTDEAFELLGVENPGRMDDDALYGRLYNSYRILRDLIDPEPGSIRRILTKAEVAVMHSRRDPDECAAKRERANVFVNAILHGTWMLLPRDVRRQWKGNVAIDATFVRAAASRGTTKRSDFCSSDPDAGWYKRDGDHAAEDPTTRAKSKYQRTREAIGWGRELHTVVPYANTPGDATEVPPIVLSATFDNPGRNLARNALGAIDAHLGHDRSAGTVVTDRAYLPHAKAEDLALPLRARGYALVMDYDNTEAMLGVQASHEGAVLIEGTWYCPSMPEPLQTASLDYLLRAEGDPRRITDDEYRQRIAQRERYRLRNKQNPDDEGYTRKMCPAAGPSATVVCPLQEQHPKTAAKTGLTKILTLNLIDPAPKVCTNQSTLTFAPQIGAKYEQAHPYKSKVWQKHYTHGRQAVESVNKSIKDGRFQPIDDTERRPRRGWIATLLAVVVMVAANNVRKIKDWLLERQGVAALEQRKPKKRARRRDLTDGYRLAPSNDPPTGTVS